MPAGYIDNIALQVLNCHAEFLLTTRMARPFSAGLVPSQLAVSLQHCMRMACPIFRTLHLSLLTIMKLLLAYSCSLPRLPWMAAVASSMKTDLPSLVWRSAKNLLSVHCVPSESLMNILKRTCSSITPWSLLTGHQSDFQTNEALLFKPGGTAFFFFTHIVGPLHPHLSSYKVTEEDPIKSPKKVKLKWHTVISPCSLSPKSVTLGQTYWA